MIEEGRAFGLAIAIKRLLRKLESKGLMSGAETQAMLDEALDELDGMKDVLSPSAAADAHKAVGALCLPNVESRRREQG